jgi:hypothetical protein
MRRMWMPAILLAAGLAAGCTTGGGTEVEFNGGVDEGENWAACHPGRTPSQSDIQSEYQKASADGALPMTNVTEFGSAFQAGVKQRRDLENDFARRSRQAEGSGENRSPVPPSVMYAPPPPRHPC